jgi:hypothetical protein
MPLCCNLCSSIFTFSRIITWDIKRSKTPMHEMYSRDVSFFIHKRLCFKWHLQYKVCLNWKLN